jgi:hypothetical protein
MIKIVQQWSNSVKMKNCPKMIKFPKKEKCPDDKLPKTNCLKMIYCPKIKNCPKNDKLLKKMLKN